MQLFSASQACLTTLQANKRHSMIPLVESNSDDSSTPKSSTCLAPHSDQASPVLQLTQPPSGDPIVRAMALLRSLASALGATQCLLRMKNCPGTTLLPCLWPFQVPLGAWDALKFSRAGAAGELAINPYALTSTKSVRGTWKHDKFKRSPPDLGSLIQCQQHGCAGRLLAEAESEFFIYRCSHHSRFSEYGVSRLTRCRPRL